MQRSARLILLLCIAQLSACGAPPLEELIPTTQAQRPPESFARRPVSGQAPHSKSIDFGNATQSVVVRGSGQFTEPMGPRAVSDTADNEPITLNLVNAPIAAVAKAVLGDVMKVNYVVSEKLTGAVTLQTARPVSKDGLFEIFETVLKANGAVVVSGSNHYRIVPSSELGAASIPVTTRTGMRSAGIQTKIFQLQHIGVVEMRRVLEPMLPQGAILRADEQRNILVISGSAGEIDNATDLLGTFDVDWLKGMSFALYPTKTSNPETIVRELRSIFGLDRSGPLTGLIRFIPNQRLGSILVVSARAQLIDRAHTWIKKLDDVAEQREEQLFSYKIQNRPAAELAALLRKVLRAAVRDEDADEGSAVAPNYESKTTDVPVEQVSRTPLSSRPSLSFSPAQGRSSLAVGSGGGTGTQVRPGGTLVENAVSDHPDRQARRGRSGPRIIADEQNSALLIHTTPKEYQGILDILRRLDVLPMQVMLEAAIAEVTLNDELKFGVKWYMERKNSTYTFTDAANGAITSVFPGFSYYLKLQSLAAVVDALSGVTKVNVISAPTLTVMDSRTALLQVGDQVPIITQSAVGTGLPGAPIVNSVTMKDTGVILSITPRVNDSGRIVLEIEQEVSSVARTTSSGIDSPTIQQRRIRTTVVVADGEHIALGGLIQEKNNLSRSQVPLLGNIPLIGTAFRQNEDTFNRTELIIMIRPQILRDAREAKAATEEFRRRVRLEAPTSKIGGGNVYHRDAQRIAR